MHMAARLAAWSDLAQHRCELVVALGKADRLVPDGRRRLEQSGRRKSDGTDGHRIDLLRHHRRGR
jgi:hypothetical protein